MNAMPIEVKQLVIKSTVQEDRPNKNAEAESAPCVQDIQAEIMAECRRLIIDILAEQKER